MDEGIAASNPRIAFEDLISEPSSRIMVVQPLINLEEEAIDVEEEFEVAVDHTTVQITSL